MQRDRQVRHDRLVRQLFERGQQADRRQRDAPRRQVEPVLVGEDAQRLHRRTVIVERLSHPHQDDVEARLAHLQGIGEHAHLPDDLARGQVADQTHLPREAEAALHRAAHLGGDAERLAGRVGNEHRFDAAVVVQLQQEL